MTSSLRTFTRSLKTCTLGGIRYGVNQVGELVIADYAGTETFVANFNRATTGNNRTAGILLGEFSLTFFQLMKAPKGWLYDLYATTFGPLLKAITGESYFKGVDPLFCR